MASTRASTIIRKAREGDVDAQLTAGRLYLDGADGLRRDARTALYWLRAAAAQGCSEAQALIGRSIPSSAVEQPQAVVDYYKRASRHGSVNASVALSDWVVSGRIPGNDSHALQLLRRAASAGDRKAQLRLAVLLQSGAFGADRGDEAFQWYEKAAANGSRAAALALANRDWERSDPAALIWLGRVGEAHDAEQLYRTGALLLGAAECKAACRWLREAAERGHAGAQFCYGLLHSSSSESRVTGVPHSLKKAASWLERASRAGFAQASFELYRLFRRREFSMKSTATAQQYLERAAQQGHAHAQFLAGIAGLRDTVRPDADVTAAGWLARAARQGHGEAHALTAVLYRRRGTPLCDDETELARLIRLMARSRIALAMRLELAAAFGLDAPEMLLLDPQTADRGDCLLIDIRGELPRTKRRIVIVQTDDERAMLDRARRLLSPMNPHPTDVRGPYLRRKIDFEHTLTILGGHLHIRPLR